MSKKEQKRAEKKINLEKQKNGICQICGSIGKMSYEHWPPECCDNKSPMKLFSSKNKYGYKLARGFGRYTLCESCNGYTGIYSNGLKDLVYQAINKNNNRNMTKNTIFNDKYESIMPLNILKCIITGFFSNNETLKNDPHLVKYVKDINETYLPTNYKIYIHYYNYKSGRHCSGVVLYQNSNIIVNYTDMQFRPFGYFLSTDGSSCPKNTNMFDITHFSEYKFNELVNVNLIIPLLEINSTLPGIYDV